MWRGRRAGRMGARVALEKRRPHELIDRYDEEADGEELLARRAVNLGHLGELVEETERDAGLCAEGGGGVGARGGA